MRSLDEIYQSYNLFVIELEKFNDATKKKPWKQAIEEEIERIENNNT